MRNNFRLIGFFMVFFFSSFIPRLNAGTELSSMLDSDKTVSMDLQDASLKDVLKIFSIQSGLNFIASEALRDRQVTLYLDNVPIKEAMARIFKANKLNYEYDEDANIFTVNYAGDIYEPEMITKIYQLKYRSVANGNLEKEKTNLFSGPSVTSGSLSSASGGGLAAAVGSGSNITDILKQLISKNGKITEDNKTNSIIITDLFSRFPVIDEIIARLDIPQPQVMLEVEMLDVRKEVVDKLGFNLGAADSPNNPFTLILGSTMSKSDFFIGNLARKGAKIDSTGVAGNVVLGNSLSMVLDFLNQQHDTKYLARPRVLTLNNETAEFGVTKDSIVSAQAKTETTAGGSSSTSVVYERATSLSLTPEGIGIFLRVTPQINIETGEINLVINPKTSSITQSRVVVNDQIAFDPEVRSTKSIIKVLDGETVVLGGLIHQEKDEIDVKVPIFGDIPILGALFRHKSVDPTVERELLVFITPRIIKEKSLVKLAQSNKPLTANSAYPGQQPMTTPERKQAIIDMLNTFERERSKR